MPMDVIAVLSLAFTAASSVESIGELLGFIENVRSKVDALLQAEMAAAVRNLEQAQRSSSEEGKKNLFQEARNCFNKAISLEKNERKISAYVGLAFCHFALNDESNGLAALRDVGSIEYEPTGKDVLNIAVTISIPVLRTRSLLEGKNPFIMGCEFRQLQSSVAELERALSSTGSRKMLGQ